MMMDMTLNLPEDAYQPDLSRDQYAAKVVVDAIRRGWEPEGDDQRQGTNIAELVDRDEYERYWRDGKVFNQEENLLLWRAAAQAVKYEGPTTITTEDHHDDEHPEDTEGADSGAEDEEQADPGGDAEAVPGKEAPPQ